MNMMNDDLLRKLKLKIVKKRHETGAEDSEGNIKFIDTKELNDAEKRKIMN